MRSPGARTGRAAAMVVAAAMALGSGCYRLTFKFGKAVPEEGPPREVQHHSLASGLWDLSGPVSVENLCPKGVASVYTEESAADGIRQNLGAAVVSSPALLLPPLVVGAVGAYWFAGRHLQPWAPSTVRLTCAKGTAHQVKVVVLRLEAKGGVEPEMVGLFTDALVGEIRKNPGVIVMTGSDVEAVLGAERQKQLLGCTDASCLTEMAGALGADRVVHGSIGRVGGSLLVNLTSLDSKNGRAVASVSERLKGGGDEAFLDMLPTLVFQLISESLAR